MDLIDRDFLETGVPLAFLDDGGELASLIREFNWSATALGPIERWSHSLRTIVGFIVLSPVALVMLWGRDGVMIYNDAYAVFAGGRHPDQLGSSVCDGWPESRTSTPTSSMSGSPAERSRTRTRS